MGHEPPPPPRLKDWKAGRRQIGLFIRSPDGGVIEAVSDDATLEVYEAAKELLIKISKQKKR